MKIKKRSRWYQEELTILFLAALLLFITAALLTYNATDSCWAFYSTHPQPLTNKCGILGAQCAALLVYLFGSSAFVIIALVGFILYTKLTHSFNQEWDRIASLFVLLVAWSSVCSMYQLDFWAPYYKGGLIGLVGYASLHYFFDSFGTAIFLYVLILSSCIILLRFSFISFINRLLHIVARFVASRKIVIKIMRNSLNTMQIFYGSIIQLVQRIKGLCTYWVQRKQTQEEYFFAEHETLSDDDMAWFSSATKTDVDVQALMLKEKLHTRDENSFAPSTHDAYHSAQFQLPPPSIFKVADEPRDKKNKEEQHERARLLKEKLEKFGVHGTMGAIKKGPVITLFEYEPDAQTKISKITGLEDDLALALQAMSVRIIAPIPGRSVVGFEVANATRQSVVIGSIIQSRAFQEFSGSLPLILGEDTSGAPQVADLIAMPHLLVAGSTGSGKSVALNTLLIGMLCKLSPDQLKLILIDPKRLEFAAYHDIPHLLFPIVTDPRQAAPILKWVVHEMEKRYALMAKKGRRTIDDFNASALAEERIPYIVLIIDELADLMMTAGKEIEDLITRIAQMARAAGIHLIVATQRPSVDVLTGLIKVNFPSRISFRVTSKIDSRTILDTAGAEKLLGKGDMLMMTSNGEIKRIHGGYVSDNEIIQVVEHLRSQKAAHYIDLAQELPKDYGANTEKDPLFSEIIDFITTIDEISISLLQRKFRIGYNRSARIIEMLEIQGFILPSQGSKTRKVIKKI